VESAYLNGFDKFQIAVYLEFC